MSSVDYRCCDACGCKVFYDAMLNYNSSDDGLHGLDRLGSWIVLCIECTKTHDIVIVELPKKENTNEQ